MRLPPSGTPTAAAHRRLRQRQSGGHRPAGQAPTGKEAAEAEPPIDQENETSDAAPEKNAESSAKLPAEEAPPTVLGESASHATASSNNNGGVDSFVAALKRRDRRHHPTPYKSTKPSEPKAGDEAEAAAEEEEVPPKQAAPPGAYRRLNAKVKRLEVHAGDAPEEAEEGEDEENQGLRANGRRNVAPSGARGTGDAGTSTAQRRRERRAAIFKAGKHPTQPSAVHEASERRASDERSVALTERDRIGSDEEIVRVPAKTARRPSDGKDAWTPAAKGKEGEKGMQDEEEVAAKEGDGTADTSEAAAEQEEDDIPVSKPSMNRWKLQEDQLHLSRLRRSTRGASKAPPPKKPSKETEATASSDAKKTPRSNALDVWKNAGGTKDGGVGKQGASVDEGGDGAASESRILSGKAEERTPKSRALEVWKNAGGTKDACAQEEDAATDKEAEAARKGEASPSFAGKTKAFDLGKHSVGVRKSSNAKESPTPGTDARDGEDEEAAEEAEEDGSTAQEDSHLRQFQRRRHLFERRRQTHDDAGSAEVEKRVANDGAVDEGAAADPTDEAKVDAKEEGDAAPPSTKAPGPLNAIQRKRQLFERRMKANEPPEAEERGVRASEKGGGTPSEGAYIGDVGDANNGSPGGVAETEEPRGDPPKPRARKDIEALFDRLEAKITSQTKSLQETKGALPEGNMFATFEPEWATAPSASGEGVHAFPSATNEGGIDFFGASAFDAGAFGEEASAFEEDMMNEASAFEHELDDIFEDGVAFQDEAREAEKAFEDEVDLDDRAPATLPALPEEGPAEFESEGPVDAEGREGDDADDYGAGLPAVPEEGEGEWHAKLESFQAGLDDERRATFYEILAVHEARILRLEESNQLKADEVEFLKGEMMGQHDQILGLLEDKPGDADAGTVAALNREVADLRLRLEASEAAVRRLGSKNGGKGAKKAKGSGKMGLRLGSKLKLPMSPRW